MDFSEYRDAWLSGDAIACASLAARLDVTTLVGLATDGLAACAAAVEAPPSEAAEVVRVGANSAHWAQAHKAFDRVRNLTLAAERGAANSNDPRYLLLFVAENSARVIYNASRPPDPFDDDSPEWLLRTMSQFLNALPEQSRRATLSAVEKLLLAAK